MSEKKRKKKAVGGQEGGLSRGCALRVARGGRRAAVVSMAARLGASLIAFGGVRG